MVYFELSATKGAGLKERGVPDPLAWAITIRTPQGWGIVKFSGFWIRDGPVKGQYA